jgi:heat shock transcription factor
MGVDRSQVSNADVSTTANEGSENPLEATKDGNQNSSADVGTADPTTPRGDAQVATELAPAAPPVVVNDKFWEQFLTERPGCCETEDASSGLRSDPPMDKGQTEGNRKDGREDLEQLKL